MKRLRIDISQLRRELNRDLSDADKAMVEKLQRQTIQGVKVIESIPEIVARRISPEMDMSVFDSWRRKQKEIIRYLQVHIDEFVLEDRIRTYSAALEFENKRLLPFLSERLAKEDDKDCRMCIELIIEKARRRK